jgi:hypothetical protein
MKAALIFVALLTYTLSIWAAQPLVSFNDPIGDDNGSGTLSYPQRADYQSGDLDLQQLSISREETGFWFTAKFKNTIHDPRDAPSSIGGESLANFARKGFYQFNVDIYIDTDRINASGNTFSLPGRHIQIDPRFAWERAVILTPRPELMRHQLIDVLAEQFPGRTVTEIEASVDESIIFPTRIKAHGKTIDFFVPTQFLTGGDGVNWAVTAFVTGALTSVSADLSFVNSSAKPIDRLQLGVMQPMNGYSKESFGFSGRDIPSPVVDLLAASAEQQVKQLGDKEALTGIEWASPQAGFTLPVPRGSASATTVVPIGKFFQAESPSAVPAPISAPTESGTPVDRTISQRLQTLQKLYDQKLIDEEDYKQQKLRILQEI